MSPDMLWWTMLLSKGLIPGTLHVEVWVWRPTRIASPLSLVSSRRPCGHQWNVRQWSTILWRRRCRCWSGCTMHLRRYVSAHTQNWITMPFVITHKEILLYPSIVSYSIFASGRAAAIFYTIVSVPAGARRQFFWLFLLCAGSVGVENTNHPQPRAKLPDSGVLKRQVWAGCWRWRLGGLVPQQALCGYAAAAHASHTRCLGWLPTGFGAHHMRRRQREHAWCEFPQTVSKSITLSFNTNTYLNSEVRRNGKTEHLWFWKWCARYRI